MAQNGECRNSTWELDAAAASTRQRMQTGGKGAQLAGPFDTALIQFC